MRVAWAVAAVVWMTPCASVLADPPPVEAIGGVSLPALPVAVARSAADAAAAVRGQHEEPEAAVATETETNLTVTVAPGATELVRIARNYLNHLQTPFDDPKLLSANAIEVKKEGSSLYVATSSEQPVGVHIRSNDPTDLRNISLTLIPARIPPRTITLKWPDTLNGVAMAISNPRAKKWEEAAPYEQTLLELVEIVARGEIPDGYALSENPDAIPCALPGVEFVNGQRLTGSHFSVFVLRATNVGESPIELMNHAGCNFAGIALVAPWPSAYLDPQVSTELFVAVVNERFEPRVREHLRPSLLTR